MRNLQYALQYCKQIMDISGAVAYVASFLLWGGGGKTPKCIMYVTYICARSRLRNDVFSGLQIHLHTYIHSLQFPFITFGMAL